MSTLTRLICTLTIMGSFLTTHAANMNGEKRRNELERFAARIKKPLSRLDGLIAIQLCLRRLPST